MSDADKLTGFEPALGGDSPVTGTEPSLPGDFEVLKALVAIDLDRIPEDALERSDRVPIMLWKADVALLDSYAQILPEELRDLVLRLYVPTQDSDISEHVRIIQQRGSAALPALLNLCSAENTRSRSAAILVVGRIGDPAAIPTLIECLQGTDTRIRRIAAVALRNIGIAAVPVLLPLLLHSEPQIREYATEVLGSLRSVEAVPRFAELLKDDENPRVLRAIAHALANIADPGAILIMERILDYPDDSIRQTILASISRFSGPEAVESLQRIVNTGSPDTRRMALVYLGKTRHPGALKILEEALTGFDSWDRWAAIDGLREFGDPEVIPVLERMLQDKVVSGYAMRAIQYLQDPHLYDPPFRHHHRRNGPV